MNFIFKKITFFGIFFMSIMVAESFIIEKKTKKNYSCNEVRQQCIEGLIESQRLALSSLIGSFSQINERIITIACACINQEKKSPIMSNDKKDLHMFLEKINLFKNNLQILATQTHEFILLLDTYL